MNFAVFTEWNDGSTIQKVFHTLYSYIHSFLKNVRYSGLYKYKVQNSKKKGYN